MGMKADFAGTSRADREVPPSLETSRLPTCTSWPRGWRLYPYHCPGRRRPTSTWTLPSACVIAAWDVRRGADASSPDEDFGRLPMRRPILYSQRPLSAARCDRVHRFRLIGRAYFLYEPRCGRRTTTLGGRRCSADRGDDRCRSPCRLGRQSGRPHCDAGRRSTRERLIVRPNKGRRAGFRPIKTRSQSIDRR